MPVDLYRSNIVCQASHCLSQVQHMWLDGYSQNKLAAACAPYMRKGLALPASVLQVLCPCIMRSRCAETGSDTPSRRLHGEALCCGCCVASFMRNSAHHVSKVALPPPPIWMWAAYHGLWRHMLAAVTMCLMDRGFKDGASCSVMAKHNRPGCVQRTKCWNAHGVC